jgi:hypothetical protein
MAAVGINFNTLNFQILILNSFSDTERPHLKTHDIKSFDQDMYIPPNYGAPDSQHGSGTR